MVVCGVTGGNPCEVGEVVGKEKVADEDAVEEGMEVFGGEELEEEGVRAFMGEMAI